MATVQTLVCIAFCPEALDVNRATITINDDFLSFCWLE